MTSGGRGGSTSAIRSGDVRGIGDEMVHARGRGHVPDPEPVDDGGRRTGRAETVGAARNRRILIPGVADGRMDVGHVEGTRARG